jgi:hypothetical protein
VCSASYTSLFEFRQKATCKNIYDLRKHADRSPILSQHAEDASGLLVAIAMFNGIHKRVPAKAGVHLSLVSRVARGERNSQQVSVAIREELRVMRDYLNRTAHKTNGV